MTSPPRPPHRPTPSRQDRSPGSDAHRAQNQAPTRSSQAQAVKKPSPTPSDPKVQARRPGAQRPLPRRDQTPKSTAPAKEQKIKLTPREERLYRMKRREDRKRAWKSFKFYFTSSLVLYIVFMLIWAMGILIKINSFPKSDPKTYDVFFADREQNGFSANLSGKLYKKNDLEVNGMLYLSTDTLSQYTPLTEGGNSAVRTVYIGESQASFDIGTTNATVNGQKISMSAPSVIVNSRLCVPMDFFVGYVEGINIEFDTEKIRFIVTYVSDIDFKPAEDSGSESISYDEYLQLLHNSKQ